jgi:hypothetical protein
MKGHIKKHDRKLKNKKKIQEKPTKDNSITKALMLMVLFWLN